MSKITEYTSVNAFDSGDVLLKDGTNGTKIIPVESAASEFLRLGGQTAKNAEIETAFTNFGSNLAGLEAEYVATNDYAVGDFFMVENKLYKATEPISEGDTITPDTNCVETDISTEFKATKNIVDGLSEDIVKKANVDGYYTNLSAGTADQLMASQKVHNSDPYIFRKSGGTSDIGNREELEIVGGSVVWNQLITDAVNNLSASQVTKTVNNGEVTITSANDSEVVKGATNDHLCEIGKVYLIGAYFKTDDTSYAAVGFRNGGVSISAGNDGMMWTNNASYTYMARIAKLSALVAAGIYVKNNTPSGGSATFKNVQIFDLTAMFGSEIADHIYELEQAETGAGVAWFRKYFPNDYYAYNPGELMHVTDLHSHSTVGFNAYDHTTGTAKLVGGHPYQITGTYTALTIDGEAVTLDSDGCFTPEKDCALTVTGGNNTTTCVHLVWSGTRDGEYEPYVKHSYPLDPSLTLRGVPKLTTDGDLTYDGDIYKPDGTVERRYGVVDLGTLSWTRASTTNRFAANLSMAKQFAGLNTSAGDRNENLITSKYVTVSGDDGYNAVYDKAVSGSYWNGRNYLQVNDETYADAESFKAAMSGVYLVYELAEPTTEEAEPYTSPQIVDDWGTEEFVTTSIVPVGHNTAYPANLRDKLQHLPDLPDNDGYYMIQVDGTQMSLIRFRIPQAPAEDGTYVLKATVTDGVPVYTWVDPDAVPETEEPTEP